MSADHELVITWDGDTEYISLVCKLTGADRPCALIDCPVCIEYGIRECIAEHGAEPIDECWAVEWAANGGRKTLDVQLPATRIPVTVAWDEGVLVRETNRQAKDGEL